MLKIVVCDDDFKIFLEIKDYVTRYSIYANIEIEMTYCPTAQVLLDISFKYDILFLDIMLDNNNDGIEIGKQLRHAGNTALFILTTSRTDRTLDGYEATVFRYLIKPVCKEKIYSILDAAILTMECDRHIMALKFKFQTHYIHVKDIIYIESYMRKRYVVTHEGRFESTAGWPILIKQLSEFPYFFSPRKTHFINLMHVAGQSPVGVTLSNKHQINFSRGKYAQFLSAFSNFLNRRCD